MKKIITLLAFFATVFTAKAQVPQAVCYQAVATDVQGRELISQSVRVRLSILRGSTAGVEEWIETFSVTTDGFGLFDLQIGTGTRTGGAQSVFSGIKWGTDKFFLKVEMDVSGGTNYVLMGTNQMVSVPYALYADKAASAVSADSARYATRAGTAATADSAVSASRATFAINSTNSVNATNAVNAQTAINSTNAINAQTALYARRSDTANFAWYADSSRRAYQSQRSVLADSAFRAQIATNALNANRAIIADSSAKAKFAFTAGYADSAVWARTALDDRDRDPTNEIQTLSFDTTTSILRLSKPGGPGDIINLAGIPLRAAGASIDYPFGIIGDPLLITTNYTVPSGKTLFVSSTNNEVQLADGKKLRIEPGMPIVPQNTNISSCFCSGLLVDNQTYATPLILDFTDPSKTYRIPDGYYLIIKSGTNPTRLMSFMIDSDTYDFYSGANFSPRLAVIPSGKTIRKPATMLPTVDFVITGYLLKR